MEKLSVKSLQIGDYVNYRGQIIKVTSLYDKGGSNEVGWSEKESVWVNADNVEPIPLTAEILEKNEFVLDDEWYIYTEQGINIAVAFRDDNEFVYDLSILTGSGSVDIHAKYVHELQHAMRLCNINKTIEL